MKYVYLKKEYIKADITDGPWEVVSENPVAEYNYDGAFSAEEEIFYNLEKDGLEIYHIPQRFIVPISDIRENIIKQILE